MKITENSDKEYSVLLCPQCGGDVFHIERVDVAARPNGVGSREKQTFVSLTPRTEKEIFASPDFVGQDAIGHYVSLLGWCSFCGETSAVSFIDEDGRTIVKTSFLQTTWGSIYRAVHGY
jgi:hypothetical protein